MSMRSLIIVMLIDTNIWIHLYEAGLTWVIREIVKLPRARGVDNRLCAARA